MLTKLYGEFLTLRGKGQGLVEYAIIVLVVVLVAVTVGALFTGQITTLFTRLGAAIAGAGG